MLGCRRGPPIASALTSFSLDRSYDIGIKDGRITALAPAFTAEEIGDAKVIDAE